jgi:Tol biopolymer transport system component
MDADGENQHYLAQGSFPAWSSDGSSLAFSSGGIYSIDARGQNQRRLTADDDRNSNYYPVWSRDGKRIAFISVLPGQAQAFLQVVEVDNRRQSTLLDIGQVFSPPAWSPDDLYLAFNSSRDGAYKMYVLRLRDSRLIAQSESAAGEEAPEWAADGKRIIFVDHGSSSDMQICVFDLAALGRRCLTQSDSVNTSNFMPRWSPDGEHLVFASNRGDLTQLYVMDTDGGNQRRLTDGNFDSLPAWSPDGTQIAFVSERDGNDEIYVTGINGSNTHRLTETHARDILPVWQP